MNGLDALVTGLFDYAGMFPPASLSLGDALRASASFPKTLQRPALMAADLVLAFDKLEVLDSDLLSRCGFKMGRTFRMCVLGSDLDSEVAAEAERIRTLNLSRSRDPVPQKVVSYEVKLNFRGGLEGEALRSALSEARDRLWGQDILVFVEPDLSGPDYEDTLVTVCGALTRANGDSEGPRAGLKVRGAGPSAIDNGRLARVIVEICRRGLPFKATAGLHHPILEECFGNALGFLNCAAALALHAELGPTFPEERVLECLETRDASAFRLGEGLAWKGFHLSSERVRRARQRMRFTIGSCSLEEPDADLSRLFAQESLDLRGGLF